MCVSVYVHVFVCGCVHTTGGDIHPCSDSSGISSLWTLGIFLNVGDKSFISGSLMPHWNEVQQPLP